MVICSKLLISDELRQILTTLISNLRLSYRHPIKPQESLVDTVIWQQVEPGHKQWVTQTFTAANGQGCTVSLGVVRGSAEGPTCTHIAGQHGMEHVGPIVLRDLFEELDPTQLRGTLLLVPCANPLALALDFEGYPETLDPQTLIPGAVTAASLGVKERSELGELNMNRLWPAGGEPDATGRHPLAGQIVRWLWRHAVCGAAAVIDHHAVRCALKPYLFAEQEVLAWTPILGMPAVWCTGSAHEFGDTYPYRRLCMSAIRAGQVGICIEYSTQFTIREPERAMGRFAVLNLCRALGMLEGEVEMPRDVWLIPGHYWDHSRQLTSAAAGHVHFFVDEYEPIAAGQTLAEIRCVQTHAVLDRITAPTAGLMLDRTTRCLHRSGEPVCRVATTAQLLARAGERYPVPPGIPRNSRKRPGNLTDLA